MSRLQLGRGCWVAVAVKAVEGVIGGNAFSLLHRARTLELIISPLPSCCTVHTTYVAIRLRRRTEPIEPHGHDSAPLSRHRFPKNRPISRARAHETQVRRQQRARPGLTGKKEKRPVGG